MRRYKRKICFSLLVSAVLLFVALCCALASKSSHSHKTSSYWKEKQTSSVDKAFEDYVQNLFCQEIAANGLSLHYTLEHPENLGVTVYNTSLEPYSAENLQISAALAENVSAVLQEFDIHSLSPENQITLELLLDTFHNIILSASFPWYEEPLRPTTGQQTELPVLLSEYSFSDTQDVTDYLAILESIPAYFDSICIYESEKYQHNLFMPNYAARQVINQCHDFTASIDNHYLLITFNEKIDQLTELNTDQKNFFKGQNYNILTQKVFPAYQSLAKVLESLNDRIQEDPNPQNQSGLCHLPQGRDYYQYLVKLYTGSNDSVEILQDRIQKQRTADSGEIVRLQEKYPNLLRDMIPLEAGSDSSFPVLSLTPDKMLNHLQNQMKGDFPTISDCHHTVKYVPSSLEAYMAPAFYLTSPLDHYTENTIYINRSCQDQGLSLFTTLAHEGYPGHLFQNAAFCSSDPQPIRVLLGPPGYSEGWATYVEMLSYHYAGLPEELADVLALEQAIILSLYATADLGIHNEGWSLPQTIDFFSGYGFTNEATIREIFQLIVEEPAHYLKYYVGYLEFLSLKDYAKETFDSDYSDKAFHQAVLKMGPATFPLLKKYLPDFYEP